MAMNRGVTPPIRRTSEGVIERVLDATQRLVVGRRWDDIPINDICNEAGVSHSSLYARFRSKEAILHTLHETFMRQVLDDCDVLTAEIIADDLSLDDAVMKVLRFVADRIVSNRDILRVFIEQPDLIHWRRSHFDPPLIHKGVVLVSVLVPGIPQREAQERFETISHLLLGGVIRAVVPPSEWSTHSEIEFELLIERWAELTTSYFRGLTDPSQG